MRDITEWEDGGKFYISYMTEPDTCGLESSYTETARFDTEYQRDSYVVITCLHEELSQAQGQAAYYKRIVDELTPALKRMSRAIRLVRDRI